MKIAAYQAPLLRCGSMEALDLIRRRIDYCEAAGVEILCCPEAILGGLADYAPRPTDIALDAQSGQLSAVLAPLASDAVTTILGFTEITEAGHLYNAAAVFHRGTIAGLYRKLHPAINKSVYNAGDRTPVFRVGGLTFGILICNDSNYPEPAKLLAAQGATVLFIPANNGLPPGKADVAALTRNVDSTLAIENKVTVIRADVAGHADGRMSYGSSGVVGPDGLIRQSARRLTEDLLVIEVDLSPESSGQGLVAVRH